MPSFKYGLDPSSKKYSCPQCKHKSLVVYLDNETKQPVDQYQFGRCDRENSCGYHEHPNQDPELAKKAKEDFTPVPEPEVVQIFPPQEVVDRIINRTRTCVSPFHKHWNAKGVPNDHLLKWGIYSDEEKTVFVFRDTQQRVTNLKTILYKEDGHRDKNFDAFSLKNPSPPRTPPLTKTSEKNQVEKYRLGIFGEHLFDPKKEKIVCMVESEKTAAIAAFFYPQYDWGSCGSNNGLTNGKNGTPDKVATLEGRKVWWLSDADKASRYQEVTKDGNTIIHPSSIRNLVTAKVEFELVDLFPERNDGYDICDAIDDGLRPEIKPTQRPTAPKASTIESDDQYDYDLPDGVDFESVKWDIRKYMHFEHKGKIYIVRKRKGDSKGAQYFSEDVTNFTIKSLGLISSELEPSRLVEIKNIHGFTKVVQVPTKAFASPNEFTVFIESVGNYQYDGIGTDLKKIRAKLYDTMLTYDEVKRLGWQDGYMVFANGVYNGKFEPIDKYGFVKMGDRNFFIQPLSCITRDNSEDFEDEKKFIFRDRKEVTLKDWSKLFCQVHKDNGRIALAWYISSLFRDLIYARFKFFPHLFLFGPPGTGKSQLAWSIRALCFVGLKKPFNLNSGTDVSFYRELAQYVNVPCWYDEFGLGLEWKRSEALKNAYDGAGHAKAVDKSETRSKKTPVHSACLISGQALPVMDNALFKRVILEQFHQTEYTDQERSVAKKLQDMETAGLTHITAGFMHFRKLMEEKYLDTFEVVVQEMMADVAAMQFEVEDRILRNSCVILTTIKLLQERIADKLPYTYAELKETILKNVKSQMVLISNANETNTFWDMVEFLFREKKIAEGDDFVFESGKKIIKVYRNREDVELELPKPTEVIYVRFGKIIPLYKENFRRQNSNNANAMDKSSLMHYLAHSKPFIGLISNVNFKGIRTSAHAFNYEMLRASGLYLGDSQAAPGGAADQGAVISEAINPAAGGSQDDLPF